MGKDSLWRATAAYTIGLKHLLNDRYRSAAAEFERCLLLADSTEDAHGQIPQKWAREDLQRLRRNNY